MGKPTVVVIGGGATGVGILRDLAMRGAKAILLEQADLAHGTSSRFHGLLHSGARYAVKDAESGRECIEENKVLRRIAAHSIEETEGFFIRLPQDEEEFEGRWVEACNAVGIPALPISAAEARRLEPNLTEKILAAYRVPDSAVDGFRLAWQNVFSASRYGGEVRTYTEVIGLEQRNGRVEGVVTRNRMTGLQETIPCDYVVNAAGSWVGNIAAMAGIKVNVKPDRGTLVAFNHRFTSRIVNRLRPPSDGDIFVPHGSITIFGTTSSPAERPDDTIPRTEEVLALMKDGEALFPELRNYRMLRAFAGTRPLYSSNPDAAGRAASRNFTILDHGDEGLQGMVSIVGGKLTTYRLMAEKVTDRACAALGITTPCRTAEEPLLQEPDERTVTEGRRVFPTHGAGVAASRLGPLFGQVLEKLKAEPEKRQLVCECELVTLAELEAVAKEGMNFNLADLRRKTRIGMGTCQGAFCTFRGVGMLVTHGIDWGRENQDLFMDFLQSRWTGIRPILWGDQLREAELTRGIYDATLNIGGAIDHEAI